MTEYTSSKYVSTTVFINLFSFTQCPSHTNIYINISIYLYINFLKFFPIIFFRWKTLFRSCYYSKRV